MKIVGHFYKSHGFSHSRQKNSVLRGCSNSEKCRVTPRRLKHAFRRKSRISKVDIGAHRFSQRHLWEYGICADLGEQQDDVESRHDSALDCCYSQSLGTYKLIPSFCDRHFLLLGVVSGAERLSKGASMLEGNMSTGRDLMAKGNLLQIPEKKSIESEQFSRRQTL